MAAACICNINIRVTANKSPFLQLHVQSKSLRLTLQMVTEISKKDSVPKALVLGTR